jgi:hypothetical protein
LRSDCKGDREAFAMRLSSVCKAIAKRCLLSDKTANAKRSQPFNTFVQPL